MPLPAPQVLLGVPPGPLTAIDAGVDKESTDRGVAGLELQAETLEAEGVGQDGVTTLPCSCEVRR